MPRNSMRATGVRDTQRQKLYVAERGLPRGECFATPMHVEAYIRHLAQSKWFKRTFGHHVFRTERPTGRASHARPGRFFHYVAIHSAQRDEATILHEMAHCVRRVDGEWPREKGAWHGPEFAATMLLLVQHQMGTKAARTLRALYREGRVRYKQPRTLSPERRAALVAQLAGVRKAACPTPTPHPGNRPSTAVTEGGEL